MRHACALYMIDVQCQESATEFPLILHFEDGRLYLKILLSLKFSWQRKVAILMCGD